MKYPIVQARENGRAATSVFLGINRLPEGREGEGAEFYNLSLDLYPAASTGGLGDTGEVIYIKNSEGATEVIDFTKLQAVAEVYEDGELLYLTGVYDGYFYYKGVKREYYACDNEAFVIAASDKVQIEKLGDVFVIFAFDDKGSKLWSYNTKKTDAVHDEEGRKKDGLLTTEIIKYNLPYRTLSIDGITAQLYLYKITGRIGDSTQGFSNIEEIEYDTGKQYYFLMLYLGNNGDRVFDGKNKVDVDYERIDMLTALQGSRLKLRTPLEDLAKEYKVENDDGTYETVSGDFYMFDDDDEEHPVTFVIDGNRGNIGAVEMERYDIDEWTLTRKRKELLSSTHQYLNYRNEETRPYYLIASSRGAMPLYTAKLNDNKDCYVFNFPFKAYGGGALRGFQIGIIGHFEKWNAEEERYELYNSDSPEEAIWKRVIADENGENVQLTPDWTYTFKNQNGVTENIDVDSVMNGWHRIYDSTDMEYSLWNQVAFNHTAIPIKSIGIETEGAKLSHITAYKNRIFGVVNDGTMLVCSELGSYTDFGEFSGISTDSGYFNSLTSGKFTGISEYQGTLVVFKADRMSIYYGDTPSDMVLSHEIKNVGCIDSDSIKEVNGQLIFLGPDGFYAYSGGQPQHISRKLAKKYTSARAFTVGRKYYASTDSELLIYDTDTGAWTSSERIELKAICGERLFLADGSVKKVLDNEEWSGDWKYESMDIFEDIMDDKGINEIYIRAKLKGSMAVSTITDEEEKVHQTIEDDGERMKVWRVPVKFKHGNFYRIRIEGNGSCILYAVERKCYAGGRVR